MSDKDKLINLANRLENASPSSYALTILSTMRNSLDNIDKDVRKGFYGEPQEYLKMLARDAMEVAKLLKSIEG